MTKKRKLEQERKRRKKYERMRNIARQIRRKERGRPTKIKYIRKTKVFCEECRHAKRNKHNRKTYYCNICDKNAYEVGLLKSWGRFEANESGDCPLFQKRLWLLLKEKLGMIK